MKVIAEYNEKNVYVRRWFKWYMVIGGRMVEVEWARKLKK